MRDQENKQTCTENRVEGHSGKKTPASLNLDSNIFGSWLSLLDKCRLYKEGARRLNLALHESEGKKMQRREFCKNATISGFAAVS